MPFELSEFTHAGAGNRVTFLAYDGSFADPYAGNGTDFPVASTTNAQHIVRRRVRRETPPEEKDERYYERRLIKNLAAKRSRDARSMYDLHIAERLCSVERENDNLKEDLKQVYAEQCDLQMRCGELLFSMTALHTSARHINELFLFLFK